MAKNTTSSEITPKQSAKTETYSGLTLLESDPNKYLEKYIENKTKVTIERLEELEKEIPKLKQKTTRELKISKQNTLEELAELRSRSDRTIETIGIFAALLSFVTFEAQIFKSDLNGFTLIGLSSLLLGALLLFVFALSNAFNPKKREDWKSYLQPLIILPALLVIIGLATASVGYKTDSQERKEIEQVHDEIKDLKLQYSGDDIAIIERINEVENKLNELSAEEQSEYLEEFKECISTKGLGRCL